MTQFLSSTTPDDPAVDRSLSERFRQGKASSSPCGRCAATVSQSPGPGRPKRYCEPCRAVVDREHKAAWRTKRRGVSS
jgi:hypothetical protein